MRISWDREGDVLHIDLVEPYLAQDSDMTDDWVLVRTNPSSGAVENVEIMGFSQHFDRLEDELELPFAGQFSALIDKAETRVLRRAANQ